MEIFHGVNSELLGLLFILGMVAIGSLIVIAISSLMKNKPSLGDDVDDILNEASSAEPVQVYPEPTGIVTYKLGHYSLQFKLIDGLWYPGCLIGDFESPVHDIEANSRFRNVFMETLLFLKVERNNQAALV